jgi:hypothetical protein
MPRIRPGTVECASITIGSQTHHSTRRPHRLPSSVLGFFAVSPHAVSRHFQAPMTFRKPEHAGRTYPINVKFFILGLLAVALLSAASRSRGSAIPLNVTYSAGSDTQYIVFSMHGHGAGQLDVWFMDNNWHLKHHTFVWFDPTVDASDTLTATLRKGLVHCTVLTVGQRSLGGHALPLTHFLEVTYDGETNVLTPTTWSVVHDYVNHYMAGEAARVRRLFHGRAYHGPLAFDSALVPRCAARRAIRGQP